MFVLSFKNKSGEVRYYHRHANEYSSFDCGSLNKASKFKTREEAEAMRDKLNRICKENGWFGLYKVTRY